MKRIVFIALAAIAFTTATHAQDSTSHKKMRMEHHNKVDRAKVFDELNLTQTQKDQMKKLREDNLAKMKDIKGNSSLTDAQKQEQIKALHSEQRKSMDALLTDEQKTKMKQLRREHMHHHSTSEAAPQQS